MSACTGVVQEAYDGEDVAIVKSQAPAAACPASTSPRPLSFSFNSWISLSDISPPLKLKYAHAKNRND